MKADLQRPDSWLNLADRFRTHLGYGPSSPEVVQPFMGLRHALWEITHSLAQTFPHRRTILLDKCAGPEFESIAIALSKDGYSVKNLDADDLAAPATWFEAIRKDAVVFFSSFDDPVTGDIRSRPALDAAFKGSRIFRVRLSHALHEHRDLTKLEPYDINILSLNSRLCIALLGERAKIEAPMASMLEWSDMSDDAIKTLLSRAPEIIELKAAVTEFEAKLPSAQRWSHGPERLYDRALATYTDVDGLSLIAALAGELAIALQLPGAARADLETLSLCRWIDARGLRWLTDQGLKPEALRGTIIIAAEVLKRHGPDNVTQALARAHAKVLKLQNG